LGQAQDPDNLQTPPRPTMPWQGPMNSSPDDHMRILEARMVEQPATGTEAADGSRDLIRRGNARERRRGPTLQDRQPLRFAGLAPKSRRAFSRPPMGQ